MIANAPLVSIGLPTYNGARYIREALDSLLAQDYANLEIIVSDNASTDETWNIIQAYAGLDERVEAIRQDRNIGAPANFNFVFRASTGPFFMWAADDDRWMPDYVTTCLQALAAVPSAVLACARLEFIDEAGMIRESVNPLSDNPDLSSQSVGRRVQELMSRAAWYTLYGLVRRETLVSTGLYREAFGADVVLLMELAILGPFVRVPSALHQTRVFDVRMDDDRGEWHNAIRDRGKVKAAPFTHLQELFSDAIAGMEIGWRIKTEAWLAMILAIYVRPTPYRHLIAGELQIRLRTAVREGQILSVVKYGALEAFLIVYRHRPFRGRRSAPIEPRSG